MNPLRPANTRVRLAGLVATVMLAAGCDATINRDIEVPAGATEASDAATVNGSIRVGDGAQVGGANFRTVNGSILVGSNARVDGCATVNGRVDVGPNSETGTLQTVNGGIRVGTAARVGGDVEVVNGEIRLDQGVAVEGDVGTVNGDLELRGVEVAGNVSTVTGDMLVTDGSVVKGRLLVREDTGTGSSRAPRIVIGAGSRVMGGMEFRRPVTLYVHESAEVGEIVGAEPVFFSGDAPGNE